MFNIGRFSLVKFCQLLRLVGLKDYFFWCPEALKVFLSLRYGIDVSIATARKYLNAWGYEYRRPRQWSLWRTKPKNGYKNFYRTVRRAKKDLNNQRFYSRVALQRQ